MDKTDAEFFWRTVLKIPMYEMMTILKAWDFFSKSQLQTVNFRQRKEQLALDLVLLFEKSASLNDAALLEIIYTQVHRHQKVWDVFQMREGPDEDVDLFDVEQFKSSFKKTLQRALRNVTVSFRVAEESAVWIRTAWGTQNSRPTYVVYDPQTPYALAPLSILKSTVPLLSQALKMASNHHQIMKMDLRSQHLDSLKAIVFKQYNQVFENHNSTTPLQDGNPGLDRNVDPRLIHENTVEKERVQRITEETFGDCPPPQLEFAQFKLETRFKSDMNRGILAERKEPPPPAGGLVKFSSPHLSEALKSLAPAEAFLLPLWPLSCKLRCVREGRTKVAGRRTAPDWPHPTPERQTPDLP
ncbi:centromere protein N-like [Thomomys bottae]